MLKIAQDLWIRAGTNSGVHEKTRFYEKNTATLVSVPYQKNKVKNPLIVRGEIDVIPVM